MAMVMDLVAVRADALVGPAPQTAQGRAVAPADLTADQVQKLMNLNRHGDGHGFGRGQGGRPGGPGAPDGPRPRGGPGGPHGGSSAETYESESPWRWSWIWSRSGRTPWWARRPRRPKAARWPRRTSRRIKCRNL